MKNLAVLFSLLMILNDVKAENFYCWAIDGLNIRQSPSSSSKIIGKVKYGEKIDINLQLTDFSNYYEELFLIGSNEDKSADIKITGSWFCIETKGVEGYIISGYLSRYPPFEIKKLKMKLFMKA